MQPSAIPQSPITQSPISNFSQLQSLSPQQPQAAPPKPAVTKQPSWLEKLLPTAGGVLGGIAGSFASPILGSAAGAGIGGALGQEAENALTGNKGSVVASGAENAAGGILGGVGGKALSSILGGLSKPAENIAAKLFAGQAPKGSISPELAQGMTKLGFGGLEDAGKFGNIITGKANTGEGQALVNTAVEDLVKNNGPQQIQISDLGIPKLMGGRASAIGPEALRGTNNIQQQIIDQAGLDDTRANQFRSNLSSLQNKYQFDINGNVAPIDALNYQRDLSRLAGQHWNDYFAKGNLPDKSLGQAYSNASDEIGNRLNLKNIQVPLDTQKALGSDILEYGNPINKSAAESLSQAVQQPNMTVGQLRNIESDWVQVSNAIQDANKAAAKNFGASTANVLPVAGSLVGLGGKKAAVGAGLGMIPSGGAEKVGSSLLSGFAKNANSNIAQKVLPRAVLASTIAGANLPNIASGNVQSNGGAIPPEQAGVNTMQPQASPYDEMIQSALAQNILAPGPYGASSGGLLQALAPQLQKAAVGQAQLGGQQAALAGAGGPQGLLSGLLTRATGLIPGTPQAALNAQSGQLTNTLGLPAGMAPNVMQNPMTAGSQAITIQDILNALGGMSAVPAQ